MAEELFKNTPAPVKAAAKTEPSGNPATPGEQPNQPKTAPDANQTGSGPSNVTPPAKKEEGKGDPAQTTQTPEDGKQAPSSSGSAEGTQQAQGAQSQTSGGDDEDNDDDAPQQSSELEMLKRRASMMGLTYSNNIGLEALKAKVQAAMDGEREPEVQKGNAFVTSTSQHENAGAINALSGVQTKQGKKISLRQHLQQEKMKLIRVRITNLDPKKKDLPGEIITVANEYLGTVRKFVPFGEVTDNGYHIPKCIYDMLKERTFVSIKTRKGPKGEQIVEHQNAREFSLEVLPPLTADELAKLAAAQQAAGGL